MRSYLNLVIVLTMLLPATWASAQGVKKIAVDKQRAVQWKPAIGQYYFSHSLVFDYENKADKTKGTLKIHVDPVTGAMCFRKESSFGPKGNAYDFIIGFPDGKYIYCGADEKGKKIKVTELVKEFKPDAETKTQQKEDFITYCVPTGNKRQDFELESWEYDLSYATSDTKYKLWLTKTPFSIYALYGIEFVEAAVTLPVSFDYMYLFSSDALITELNAKDAVLKLTSFGRDPFTAITKGYQEIKVND